MNKVNKLLNIINEVMKSVDVERSSELYTDCPYCGKMISDSDYQIDFEVKEPIECPECHKKFKVKGIII